MTDELPNSEETPKRKKKIVRVRKIDKTLEPSYGRVSIDSSGITWTRLAANSVTNSAIMSGAITTNKIATTPVSFPQNTPQVTHVSLWDSHGRQQQNTSTQRLVTMPDGEMRLYDPTGTTYTLIRQEPAWPEPPKKKRAKEQLSFDQDELDKKEHWTTAEAAWHCGMSRSTWHVRMHKGGTKVYPVKIGEGRGSQNVYMADDVRRYKASLGK